MSDKITHGRHCVCSACAAEDWTNPQLACCGMHGPSCPREYAPLGGAGDRVPASSEPLRDCFVCGRPQREHARGEECVPVSPEPERNPYPEPHPVTGAGPCREAWDEGFAAGRAAFDAVVAERDEAVKKLGIAIDVTHEFEDEKIALADRLAKWERGEWPSTEAQHGVLLDQIKELAAERDAALAALRDVGVELAYAAHAQAASQVKVQVDYCRDLIEEALTGPVSGSSEPRKENE